MNKKCCAIVLAAGQGKRMQSDIQKQFMEISGYPVLYYSLKAFQEHPMIDSIIVVTGEDMISYCRKEIVQKYGFSKVASIVQGGKERYDSVYAGLQACGACEYVLIHDGARPFVTRDIIDRGMEGVQETGACVIGMPSKDTIKLVDEKAFVTSTPDRSGVWIIQTPQIFEYQLILSAHENMRKKNMYAVTDDAMVIEQETNVPVKLAKGSYYNIKITTPEDLPVAEIYAEILAER